MRRLASLGVAAVTTVALAIPALAASATAAPDHRARATSSSAPAASAAAEKGKKATIKIKKSDKGVQPGIKGLKLTATGLGKANGKVKFTVTGLNYKKSKKVKVKNGKASYKVPPLGTGKYKVKAKLGAKKGKTKFEVYDSALSVNTTTFTCSISGHTGTALSGNVKFKGKSATSGYVDIYQDGNVKGGSASPSFLGFTDINPDGTGNFDAMDGFCTQITEDSGLAGGNLGAFGPGTYNFQAYYTDDAEYKDYISSNFLVVTVVA